jgi:predicted nucleic acid-binding Zn ribbon protein
VSADRGSAGSSRDLPGARPRATKPRETEWQRRQAEQRRRPKPRDPKVRVEGTTPVGDLLAGLLSRKEFAEGMRLGRLAKAWSEVVGERLAQECRPVRLEAGTLTVAASSGTWGAQVKFLAGEIQKGANRALGGAPVARVAVVVDDGAARRLKPL